MTLYTRRTSCQWVSLALILLITSHSITAAPFLDRLFGRLKNNNGNGLFSRLRNRGNSNNNERSGNNLVFSNRESTTQRTGFMGDIQQMLRLVRALLQGFITSIKNRTNSRSGSSGRSGGINVDEDPDFDFSYFDNIDNNSVRKREAVDFVDDDASLDKSIQNRITILTRIVSKYPSLLTKIELHNDASNLNQNDSTDNSYSTKTETLKTSFPTQVDPQGDSLDKLTQKKFKSMESPINSALFFPTVLILRQQFSNLPHVKFGRAKRSLSESQNKTKVKHTSTNSQNHHVKKRKYFSNQRKPISRRSFLINTQLLPNFFGRRRVNPNKIPKWLKKKGFTTAHSVRQLILRKAQMEINEAMRISATLSTI